MSCVCNEYIKSEEPCGWLWNRFAQEQEVWANGALFQNEKTVIYTLALVAMFRSMEMLYV